MILMDDKYRLEDFGLYLEEGHDHPLTPVFEQKTMHIAGRPGMWDFGSEIKEKRGNWPIATNGKDLNELQQKLNAFVAFLFDEFGKPRTFKVVYDYEPDKYYMMKVASQFSPDRIKPFNRFVLPVVAYDPYKYSRFYSNEIIWGSEEINFAFSYLIGHEGGLGGNESFNVNNPQTIEVKVDGLAIQPIFEIEGTANNLKIECGKYSFTLPNFSNTKWVIDFEKYVVYKDGNETMEEIREFYLMPGSNAVKITGNNVNLDMRIKFRDKYN